MPSNSSTPFSCIRPAGYARSPIASAALGSCDLSRDVDYLFASETLSLASLSLSLSGSASPLPAHSGNRSRRALAAPQRSSNISDHGIIIPACVILLNASFIGGVRFRGRCAPPSDNASSYLVRFCPNCVTGNFRPFLRTYQSDASSPRRDSALSFPASDLIMSHYPFNTEPWAISGWFIS